MLEYRLEKTQDRTQTKYAYLSQDTGYIKIPNSVRNLTLADWLEGRYSTKDAAMKELFHFNLYKSID